MQTLSDSRVTSVPEHARQARFTCGEVVVTPAAAIMLHRSGDMVESYLARHASGDWTQMSIADAVANIEGISAGDAVLSAYDMRRHQRLLILTDGRRRVTRVMMASELVARRQR